MTSRMKTFCIFFYNIWSVKNGKFKTKTIEMGVDIWQLFTTWHFWFPVPNKIMAFWQHRLIIHKLSSWFRRIHNENISKFFFRTYLLSIEVQFYLDNNFYNSKSSGVLYVGVGGNVTDFSLNTHKQDYSPLLSLLATANHKIFTLSPYSQHKKYYH